MRKVDRWVLITCVVVASSLGHAASGDIDNNSAANVQEGDNESDTSQSGDAASGDAVAGQVVGVVSAGDTSLDATNRSEDVDVETGDAEGDNTSGTIVGLTGPTVGVSAADITNDAATNVQEGDNDSEISQTATVSSGDAVGGQVTGVVTAPGGVADVVVANTTIDSEASTGDAAFTNSPATVILVVPQARCELPIAADHC